jgi:hypothetical protein
VLVLTTFFNENEGEALVCVAKKKVTKQGN